MNHQQLVSLTPKLTPYKRGLGNGLSILVDPKGAKYFTGRIKGQSVWIGTFGKKGSKLSLADAKNKFNAIKEHCYVNEITFSEYKRRKNKTKKEEWVLKDAVNHFLKECELTVKETTFKEYTRKLNQVLSLIDGQTPLQELERVNGGKEIIEDIISKIQNGGKGNNFDLGNRCRNLLKQVFDLAEDIGKMGDGQNPANRKKIRKHKVTHHPTISWEEVPEVLEKVSLNPCNSHPISQLATKLSFMTFLRSGALTRLEWGMIDEKRKLLIIDGKTSGLKRKKDCNDHIPHYVPITPHMEKIFARAKRFNQGEKYIFTPIRESRFPHLDPSAPNNFLRTLGFEGKLVSHGWRSVALTNGIDLLKTPKEVIKKQMGHLPDNKVDQAYDKSLMLEERRIFLNKWCDLLVANGLEV
jgi:integrase